MKAHNATTSPTTIIAAGHYPFLHIANVSDTTVYLCYDGSGSTLTTSNGYPLASGAQIFLNNDVAPLFKRGVTVIHGGSGNKELRVQGTD